MGPLTMGPLNIEQLTLGLTIVFQFTKSRVTMVPITIRTLFVEQLTVGPLTVVHSFPQLRYCSEFLEKI